MRRYLAKKRHLPSSRWGEKKSNNYTPTFLRRDVLGVWSLKETGCQKQAATWKIKGCTGARSCWEERPRTELGFYSEGNG